MPATAPPVSDMLVTVKSREVQSAELSTLPEKRGKGPGRARERSLARPGRLLMNHHTTTVLLAGARFLGESFTCRAFVKSIWIA